MTRKIILSQSIYTIVMALYYWAINLLNGKGKEFEVVLFDYPRHGIVLYIVFSVTNLILLFKYQPNDSQNNPYPLIFCWLPFILFLAITALFFFYGFSAIGSPFKQNVFLNLLIPHIVAFIVIRLAIIYKVAA